MNIPQANYHTHSTYCDGKEPLPAYVKAAESLNFTQLGFSSHAPVPFENDFGIKLEDIPNYVAEIDRLQQTTPVLLLKALECDFIPGMSTPFAQFKQQYGLDYVIGGVHLVRPPHGEGLWFIDGSKRETYDDGLRNLFNMDIRHAVTTFWEQTFEMLETEKMDVIAHFDKIKMHNQHRFFQESETWYRTLADKALQLIKKHDVVIEINTRGIYKKRCEHFYPSTDLLCKACQMDIPVMISSDAHKSDELNLLFPEAVAELKRCGYGNVVTYNPLTHKFE